MKLERLMAIKAACYRPLRAVTQPGWPKYRGGCPGLVSEEMS
jgi:hypothetical protein